MTKINYICLVILSFTFIINAPNPTIIHMNEIVIICNNNARKKGSRNRISIMIFILLSFISILYDLTGGVQSSLPISIPPTNPNIQKHNNISIIEPIIYSPSYVRYNYIKTILTKTI